MAVAAYQALLATLPDLVAAVRVELAGRDLACWCPPESPCHGDVLLAVAAGEPVPAPLRPTSEGAHVSRYDQDLRVRPAGRGHTATTPDGAGYPLPASGSVGGEARR